MENLLNIKNLKVTYTTDDAKVYAVNGLDLSIDRGETLGVVGETGAGKTTMALSIMRLLPNKIGKITEGEIWLDGHDITKATEADMRLLRGDPVSMIFQDPMTSLNPTMTIGDQIAEVLLLHKTQNKEEIDQRVKELLALVGISEERQKDFPHQFSGGMKQRVVIAMALACRPELLLADEPTTALDATIQGQILRLILNQSRERGMAVLLITHDLGVVANIADRVAVMYAGDIVEIGTADEIYYDPRHPYTWALLSSMPQMGVKGEDLFSIPGTPPNLFAEIHGDAFAPRNPQALKIDFVKRPPYFAVSPTHKARTWLLDPRAPHIEPPAAVKKLQKEGL